MFKNSFTVYFEEPFWVGVYQRLEEGRLTVCKVTFGSEPKDAEVYDFLLENWKRLSFSPAVAAQERAATCRNPKRRQRAIAKSLAAGGVGTKAQQAVQLARQQGKVERRQQSRAEKQAQKQCRYEQRAEKKKQKHKGH